MCKMRKVSPELLIIFIILKSTLHEGTAMGLVACRQISCLAALSHGNQKFKLYDL